MSVFKQIYDKSLGNIEADARLDNNAIFTTLPNTIYYDSIC
jgi:hypothetical protein